MNTLNLLPLSPLLLFPLGEQISGEICINMQLESFSCGSEQRCWLVFLLLKNSETYLASLQHPLSKAKVFPELRCTDLSTNSCRSSYIHSPLNNPSSTHEKPNLFLEIASSLHNTCGVIEAALLFSPYKGRCRDPFQSPHQPGCSTTSLLSWSGRASFPCHILPVKEAFGAAPTEAVGTQITSAETTHFGGGSGLFCFACREALAKSYSCSSSGWEWTWWGIFNAFILCIGMWDVIWCWKSFYSRTTSCLMWKSEYTF